MANSISASVNKPSTLRFGAPTFRSQLLMPCGKHPKPTNVPAAPRQSGERPRQLAQRYRRALGHNEKRGSCMCDYHDYPELRAEKKQYSNPTCLNRTFHPFRRLPAELRNKIYGMVLKSDEALEFCPEPFDYDGEGRVRDGRDGEQAYEKVRKHHREKTESLRSDAAALMRTNHTISDEAAYIFFSENEFRFSNTSGWISLDFWLFMTGLKKASMLRHITICYPTFTVKPISISSEYTFASGCVYFHVGRPKTAGHATVLSGPGFEYKGRWWEEKSLTNDPTLIIQKAKSLHQLRFVIPAFSWPNGVRGSLESPVDAKQFYSLDVVYAGVRIEPTVYAFSYYHQGQRIPSTVSKSRTAAQAHTDKTGKICKYEDHWIDRNGEWYDSSGGESQKVNEDLYYGIEGLFAEQ